MQSGLDFRHDIAVDMKNGLPIANKLYPSHYSMLYFTKGKPKTFRKVFVPVDTCRHCSSDIKDYGGKKKFMHEEGLNLTDVWTDITVVRHKKFKTEWREANALSTKLLERVVEISTNPGDTVLDPFGGSGTTFSVCEKKNRRWIGIELDFCKAIKERLENGNVEFHENNDKYAKN